MNIDGGKFQIDDAKGVAKVSFCKSYYDKNILLEVCSEFSEHVYMIIDDQKDSFELTFITRDNGEKISEIVLEFFNYTIGITVPKLKV